MSTPPKTTIILNQLVRLRVIVGVLGTKSNSGWWNCSFSDATGGKFLATIFPRSSTLAAMNSTSEAAMRVHDQALGRKGSFHLFRLPSEVEFRIDDCAQRDPSSLVVPSRDAAMAELAAMADASITAPSGPVRIGVERKILTETSIRELAAHYHSAFLQGIHCFPYFASEES
jgi:hypothetical protein